MCILITLEGVILQIVAQTHTYIHTHTYHHSYRAQRAEHGTLAVSLDGTK